MIVTSQALGDRPVVTILIRTANSIAFERAHSLSCANYRGLKPYAVSASVACSSGYHRFRTAI